MVKKIGNKIEILLFNLLIAQTGGLLSGLLTNNISEKYSEFAKPIFSPPGFIFPIAWVTLYFLMALANYFAYKNKKASYLYFMQLLINFLWPIFFFGLDLKFFAFVWLIFLLLMVIITTKEFFKTNFISGILMLPYILWLIYAGYLNFEIWHLNR